MATIDNICPHCTVELDLNELMSGRCDSCETKFNHKSFDNIDVRCFDCGGEEMVRTVPEQFYPRNRHFYLCNGCSKV